MESLKFSTLDKALAYEIPLPTREDQLTDVLGSLYQASSPEQGVTKWRRHLLESDQNGNGTNFEIALLNALTRLGMPVFFAGQVQEAGAGGGTSTAGYDLIVLDQATRRVTLCDSKHLIAEAATLFDFWIASETELSAQSHLLVDAQALTRLRTGF